MQACCLRVRRITVSYPGVDCSVRSAKIRRYITTQNTLHRNLSLTAGHNRTSTTQTSWTIIQHMCSTADSTKMCHFAEAHCSQLMEQGMGTSSCCRHVKYFSVTHLEMTEKKLNCKRYTPFCLEPESDGSTWPSSSSLRLRARELFRDVTWRDQQTGMRRAAGQTDRHYRLSARPPGLDLALYSAPCHHRSRLSCSPIYNSVSNDWLTVLEVSFEALRHAFPMARRKNEYLAAKNSSTIHSAFNRSWLVIFSVSHVGYVVCHRPFNICTVDTPITSRLLATIPLQSATDVVVNLLQPLKRSRPNPLTSYAARARVDRAFSSLT